MTAQEAKEISIENQILIIEKVITSNASNGNREVDFRGDFYEEVVDKLRSNGFKVTKTNLRDEKEPYSYNIKW